MSRTYEQLEPVISALDERISAKAAQIAQNTSDISSVKENLSDLGLSVVDGAVNITYEEVSA